MKFVHLVIRCNRNRHGGGVAFFLSNHVGYKLCQPNSAGMDAPGIELSPGSHNRPMYVHVCCAYRPPSADSVFFDMLSAQCEATVSSKRFTILGDLNCDLLNPNLSRVKLLVDFCRDINLVRRDDDTP